jgi:hypothetical protein
MSLQAIIDQHANNMVARHNMIEEMINDQAATRANEIGEKAKAITDAYEQTGSALGSVAGAYHLGRNVYRAYKAKGLKGAAKRLADAAKESKGDLKNIKADDDEAPTRPTGTDEDDPGDVGDRLDNLVRSGREDLDNLRQQANDQASQPTENNEEANQDVRDPAGEQGEAEAAEPQEINLGDPTSDPQSGNLDFQVGGVDEPEDLQVARWSDMAERVSARNASKGLDIEGNPLRDGLKPGERVLADVTKPGKADSSQPKPQGGDEETNPQAAEQQSASAEQPAAPEQSETDFLSDVQRPQGKLFDDAPAPSDEPLSAESNPTPNIESSAADDAAKSAADDAGNITSKIASGGKTALQETGNITDEALSKTASKLGGGLEDSLPELLGETSALDLIPGVGEVVGLGLGLYGLFESIFGKKPDASDEKKIIPVAPSASGIDPQAEAQAQTLS